MRTCSFLAIALAVASTASAADTPKANAPEFLLGDLGVRVDLPGGWRMTRWSDWDFAAESSDKSVLVFVWATPLQVGVGEDAKAWAPIYTGKIEEMKGGDPKVTGGRIEEVGGRKAAFVDLSFEFAGGGGKRGAAHGATIEIEGQDLHLMAVGNAQVGRAVEKGRTDLARRLEFSAPLASTLGADIATQGMTSKLPADWRPPLDREWSSVVAVHADTLEKLGVTDVTGCWTGIRTRPAASPDLMVGCNRPVRLGVVDEHSWAAGEVTAREKLFGKSLPPGEKVELADRVGFLYAPRDGLAMGVAPDEFGAAVTWAMGDGELGPSVREVMTASTFTGDHPVETGEVVSYWLTQRTFSPQVLCPALCCLGGVGLVGLAGVTMIGLRSRKRPDEDDT